jgi:DNA topoisomerase I
MSSGYNGNTSHTWTSDVLRDARAAGLRYSSDSEPGIRRLKQGRGFRYLKPNGRAAGPKEIERIRKLAIPPAYVDVWICSDRRGHIQATARDARGRKQYRYHPSWTSIRDEAKFDRVAAFAKALPAIRARVKADLALHGLPREKVLAAIVYLLEHVLVRIGNAEYARDNDSYGLTTLKNSHAKSRADLVRFRFRAKSGVIAEYSMRDRRVAKAVRACQELPGQRLFEYVDDGGEIRTVESGDVNEYIRSIAGEEFSAKDFRTWAGTVLCAEYLRAAPPAANEAAARRIVNEALKRVARRLGNTVAVCRKAYVHPEIIDAYLRGSSPRLDSRL